MTKLYSFSAAQSSHILSVFFSFTFRSQLCCSTFILPTVFLSSRSTCTRFKAHTHITMKFSAALVATFAALAIAAPAGPHQKRAAVLTTKTYDEYASSLCF
jgi:hypothetical protein